MDSNPPAVSGRLRRELVTLRVVGEVLDLVGDQRRTVAVVEKDFRVNRVILKESNEAYIDIER